MGRISTKGGSDGETTPGRLWDVGATFAARIALAYQTSHLFPSGLTIGASALQLHAFWNSGRFDNGPMTRYFAMGCGSVCTIRR